MKKSPYWIDRESPTVMLSAVLMAVSAAVRLYYFLRTGFTMTELVFHLLLPLLSALLFLAVVLFFGREFAGVTAISVLLGVIFFIVKAFTFDSVIHTVLCVGLYLLVLALYSLTVFGIIPTKKLLYPLFGIPLLYHIFVEDMKGYILAKPSVPFVEWLPEISVLLIMGGLLSLSIGLKQKDNI